MANTITSLPSKRAIVTKKALIIGGAVVGVIIAGTLLKKVGAVEVIESVAEAA